MHRPCGFALLALICLLPLAGCQTQHPVAIDAGRIDPAQHRQDIEENQLRLAGEDHPKPKPVNPGPLESLGSLVQNGIFDRIARFWYYISNDTAGLAARKMIDPASADNRREGTLHLTDFQFARGGSALKVYAHQAVDPDYTVRAAGLRALNRSRATGYTDVFLHGLEDDNSLVRLEAAKGLANIPDPKAQPAILLHMQRDVAKDVRIACADALRNYKSVEVAHALIDVLIDKDFGVAWQAHQSLTFLTGHDFAYDEKAWLDYLSSNAQPFG